MIAFKEFPKIHRLNREVYVTEKIDGTNASITIARKQAGEHCTAIAWRDDLVMKAGSRNRFIFPDDDNFGFAKWVSENQDSLWELGEGTHFGEWWGRGIQRGYGLNERRFSLFNLSKPKPECCHYVPLLGHGDFLDFDHSAICASLKTSHAAPGFERPEGYVVYHSHSGHSYKYTFDKNDAAKGRPSGL